MKNGVQLFRNLSFKKKLMLSYILLLLVPVLLGAVYFYTSAVASIRQKTAAMIDQRLDQEKAGIDRKLAEFEKVAQNISQNSLMNDFFNGFYPEDSEFILFIRNNVSPLISWWLLSNPGISELRYYTYNKDISSFYLFYPAQNCEGQAWFENMKAATADLTPYWEDCHEARPYRNGASAKMVYSLYYPMLLPNTAQRTYLEIEVSPGSLFRQINDTPLGRSGCLFVVDEEKKIIQSSNLDLCTAVMQNMDSGKLAAWENNKHFNVKIGKVEYNVNLSRLDKASAYLIGVIPSAEVTQNLSYARNLFILILVAGFAVLTAIAYLLAGILMKKVKKLVGAVHSIQNQDFNIHIPVMGRDEIDELANDINIMSAKISDLINKVYKSEIAQKEAELAALQMQINPHFLFNTLEVLKMMAEIEEQHKISDAIASLGNLIRYNLSRSKGAVLLKDELENLEDYAGIQNLLLNNRLKIYFEVDSALLLCEVPSLIIQPLVENCIFHGYRDRNSDLQITVEAVKTGGYIEITVADNGAGISGGRLAEIEECLRDPSRKKLLLGGRHGIALTNINSRIQLKYGPDSGISLQTREGGGTAVTIRMPWSGAGQG